MATRVLVVDDEDTVCRAVTRSLAKLNLDVTSAMSGEEALERLEETDYDLVITDLMMPRMSGMDLLERVKARDEKTGVIMITGYATFRTAVTAIKLGAFDYIPKPFSPEEIRSVTLRALERRRIFDTPEEAAAEDEHEATGEELPLGAISEPPETEAEYARLSAGAVLYSLPEHAWVRVESDGCVRVGVEQVFQRTAGRIVYVDLPNEGDVLAQGNVCVTLTAAGHNLHRVWSPVSGTVVRVNPLVAENPALLNRDPLGKGWILRLRPSDLEGDLSNLRKRS